MGSPVTPQLLMKDGPNNNDGRSEENWMTYSKLATAVALGFCALFASFYIVDVPETQFSRIRTALSAVSEVTIEPFEPLLHAELAPLSTMPNIAAAAPFMAVV